MTTIGEAISRLRGQLKAESEDSFMTDRYIYSLIKKYAQLLMRRQDHASKLMKFNSVWQELKYVDLIEVDKIEAHCSGVQTGCIIKRTKNKLPTFMQGYWGPLIRTVSSIDGSVEIQPTTPGGYTSMTKTTTFKYNNNKYYWFIDGYLYLPNVDWDAIRLEGVFEEDISKWTCEDEDDCVPRYLQNIYIPEFLFSEIEQQILQIGFTSIKVPPEDADNKQNINR
tara:strand:- start:100 stop:771 length:672 start_codon:yes stop_codon:yes gene_type:complete